MPLEELLDWVDRRFVCGTLSVERAQTIRTFHFDSGYVTGASSNDPSEYLGQLLMNRGFITDTQLSDAFKVQSDTGVLLGKILLMIGAVGEHELRQVLEEKIREALFDALAWAEGAFQFERAPAPMSVSAFEVSVNLRSAIEDGQRRVHEWRALREVIPTDDMCLYVIDASRAVRPGDDTLQRSDLDRVMAELSDGASVNHVVLRMNGRRFAVVNGLAQLLERGAIAIDRRETEREQPAAVDVAELERAARGRAARGDRSGALDMARDALHQAPESESLKKLYRELERSVFAELSRDLLARFSVPKLLKSKAELDTMDMSDNERYLASRIDGRWDLLSLMRITPLREVEALITFKRLADRGIISL
jgi:hypothetical protein